MNKKVFFANCVNKKVSEAVNTFRDNGYKIIAPSLVNNCDFIVDFSFDDFLKTRCELAIISDFERRLIAINCAKNLGIKISKNILDKTLNKIKQKSFDIDDDSKIARFFLKETSAKNLIDFDGNFDKILMEVLNKISEEKILFFGVNFEEDLLFDFFKNMLKNDNISFIFLQENGVDFRQKNKVLNFFDEGDILVSFLDEEKNALKADSIYFSSNIELCDFFLNFCDRKIGIISNDKKTLNFFNHFFTQNSVQTQYRSVKNESENLSEMFINAMNEKLDFANSFCRFLLCLFAKNLIKLHKIKAFLNNAHSNGLSFLNETLNFALLFFKDDDEILKYVNAVLKFFNQNDCDFLIDFCRKNIDKNFLNFVDFKIENIDEICEILSFLKSINSDTGVDKNSQHDCVFLGSLDEAIFSNFDYIFFVDLSFSNYQKINFFNKLSIVINASKNIFFLHKNDQNFLSISSFLSIKNGVQFEKKELKFEKKQDNLCAKKIASPLVKINDLPCDFSYKKLTTYIENPYLFFTKYTLSLFEENFANKASSLKGEIFHEIFSICAKNKHFLGDNLSEIKSLILNNLFVHIFDDFLKTEIEFELDDFLSFLREIFDKNISEKGEIISEETFSFNLTINGCDLKITAKPDLIIKNDDGFCEIFDLKTGLNDDTKKSIKNELLMKSPQMLMYAWVLRKNGIHVSNFSYIYFNKKESTAISFLSENNGQNLEQKIDEFEEFFMKILSEIYKKEGVVFEYKKGSRYDEILYLSKYN